MSRSASKTKKNPYDLSDRRTPTAPRHQKSKTYTLEEQKELLHGYIKISRDNWDQIRSGDRIRYIRKGGEFRLGGIVQMNPFPPNWASTPGKRRSIKIKSAYRGNSQDTPPWWTVSYDDLEHVYVRGDVVSLEIVRDLNLAVKTMNENMVKLARQLRRVETGRRDRPNTAT